MQLLHAYGSRRLRIGTAFRSPTRAENLSGARDSLPSNRGFRRSRIATGTWFAVQLCGGIQVGRRVRLGFHRVDRRWVARHGTTFREPLKALVASSAVLDVRQDPGGILGVELSVEELQ